MAGNGNSLGEGMTNGAAERVSENPKFNSTLIPKSVLKSCRQHGVRANKRSAVSDRDVTHSDLVEIAKRNGDFKKNYGVLVGATLYLRSISAARPGLFWWQPLFGSFRRGIWLLVAMNWIEREARVHGNRWSVSTPRSVESDKASRSLFDKIMETFTGSCSTAT